MVSEPVGTFKTGNTTWSVRVQGKRFMASANGFTDVTGETWDAMENSARVAASKAKVKVDVPYVHFTRQGYRTGAPLEAVQRTATGINAGSGNVTYRDAKGTGQETSTYRSDFLKPFSPEDEASYIALSEQISSLTNQADAIKARYAFSGGLKAEVQRAIDAEHARRETEGGDSHAARP